MNKTEKKSFLLGYSYIGHSFLSYMFLSFVLVTISNEVFKDFQARFGTNAPWDDSTMLLANTLCAIFSAIVGIFLGQWVDRKGAKIVLITGFFFGGANYMIFPFVPSFALFCVCLALAHTCMLAFCQMTTHSLVTHWFNKKKGIALGLAAIGIPAGNAVLPLLYRQLSGADGHNMQMALWFFGILLFAMGVASIFWVKNNPSEVGLTPDNLPVEADLLSKGQDRSYRFSEVARTPKVWLIILIYGLMNCAVIACVAKLINYIVQKGFPENAGFIMSIGALGGIAAGFIISFADQKLGTKKTTVIYSVIAIIVYLAMFFLPQDNLALLISLCLLAFALNGAPANLMPSMIITVFGPESFNSVSKIATPIACIFRSCGYYVAALLATTLGKTGAGSDGTNWSAVYIGLAVIMAVILVLVLVLRAEPSQIRTRADEEDIFAMGEVYFGFNFDFQADVRKIKELIYGRGNTGKYISRPIPEADIREIVEAGTYVPENLDIRPWHFVALSDPDRLSRLNENMHNGVVGFSAKLRERFPGHPELKKDTEEFLESLGTATLVVMAFTDYPVEGNALANEVKQIGSAFQNMLLKAYGKGIGSYWLTSPIAAGAAPKLKAEFSPGEGEFIGMVTFGYYDQEQTKPVVRKGSVEYI